MTALQHRHSDTRLGVEHGNCGRWQHRQQVLWKISKLQFHVFMRSDKSQAAAAANYPATQVCPARPLQPAGLLGLLVWWHRRFCCQANKLNRSVHLIWQNNCPLTAVCHCLIPLDMGKIQWTILTDRSTLGNKKTETPLIVRYNYSTIVCWLLVSAALSGCNQTRALTPGEGLLHSTPDRGIIKLQDYWESNIEIIFILGL